MIEDPAIDGLGGGGQAPRGALVALARRRIAARMIVGEQDSRASVYRRVDDDRAERKVGAAFVSIVMGKVQAIQLGVDMRDPQPLAPRIGLRDAPRKECAGCGDAVELERKFGTLISHEPRLKEFAPANDRN